MTPYALALLFVAGLFAGGIPVRMYYEAKEDQRAKVEAEAALAQEKKNAAIVTQYQDLLTGVSDWYRSHPVRVRIPSSQDCPGGASPNPADVVFVVGGIHGSDRSATDQ